MILSKYKCVLNVFDPYKKMIPNKPCHKYE